MTRTKRARSIVSGRGAFVDVEMTLLAVNVSCHVADPRRLAAVSPGSESSIKRTAVQGVTYGAPCTAELIVSASECTSRRRSSTA